ncbi:MAG: hypothetical protein JXA57_20285 [Armatimonadetes bacterium]|nr:hypothetical protein [Armatimonadota bacterium]
MAGFTFYCSNCNQFLEGTPEPGMILVCPTCGEELVESEPALPNDESEEFEQEMFFLGHEGLFDDFF